MCIGRHSYKFEKLYCFLLDEALLRDDKSIRVEL